VPDIFFPSRDVSIEDVLATNDKEAINAFLRDNIISNSSCSKLTALSPYCMSERQPANDAVLATLNHIPRQNRAQLMCMIDDFGDSTRTLAALYDGHLAGLDLQDLQTTVGLVGAGATAKGARLTGLQKALLEYQNALLALNKQNGVGHGPSAQRASLRAEVQRKYDVLQQKYQAELRKLARPEFRNKNRGNALTSAQRGLTLAERRRGRHLYVANAHEAQQLARLARGIRYTGNGMIALDAGLRASSVYGTYKDGGNWQRQAAIEATGFGTGGAVGLAAGKATVWGLTALGLALTPVGWVILIGAAVAVGATAACHADKVGKSAATSIWDR
jgi:hypothetical protein